jgi:3-isopropylmalate/(R)-2-methylmalate dehydratase small subunit
MEKINRIQSKAVLLPVDNIDTDQIIPARFLKAIDKKGFGQNLFRDWRFMPDGQIIKDFPLNSLSHEEKILITGRNFGCGSSREHAAWALHDYGFRAIVSSQFADIFKNNALNNGLLPIEIPQQGIDKLIKAVKSNPSVSITINLEKQCLTCEDANINYEFPFNQFKKHCLMNGVDETEFLISIKSKIEEFEKTHTIY